MPANKSVETALTLIQNDKSKVLGLTVGMHSVTPGQLIPKAEAQEPPKVAFNATTGTYIAIGLDLDAPFASLNLFSPILHWIQPGLKPAPAADGTPVLDAAGTPVLASYIAPSPPPGSGVHRYIFLLYEQPADFNGREQAPSMWSRIRYDLGAFEKEVKLGPVVAANYFVSK